MTHTIAFIYSLQTKPAFLFEFINLHRSVLLFWVTLCSICHTHQCCSHAMLNIMSNTLMNTHFDAKLISAVRTYTNKMSRIKIANIIYNIKITHYIVCHNALKVCSKPFQLEWMFGLFCIRFELRDGSNVSIAFYTYWNFKLPEVLFKFTKIF